MKKIYPTLLRIIAVITYVIVGLFMDAVSFITLILNRFEMALRGLNKIIYKVEKWAYSYTNPYEVI